MNANDLKVKPIKPISEKALFDALDALGPSEKDLRKKAFESAYPRIAAKLAEGASEGAIIQVLASQGILSSRNTFVKWKAEVEAKVKSESGIQKVLREAAT